MARRKSYGSTPRQHRKDARRFAREGREEAARSVKASKRGDCDRALSHLVVAASWYGSEHAHYDSTENMSLLTAVRALAPGEKAVGRAQDAFRKYCLR